MEFKETLSRFHPPITGAQAVEVDTKLWSFSTNQPTPGGELQRRNTATTLRIAGSQNEGWGLWLRLKWFGVAYLG